MKPQNTISLDLKVDQASISLYSQMSPKYSLPYFINVNYKKNTNNLKDFVELMFVFKRADSEHTPLKSIDV